MISCLESGQECMYVCLNGRLIGAARGLGRVKHSPDVISTLGNFLWLATLTEANTETFAFILLYPLDSRPTDIAYGIQDLFLMQQASRYSNNVVMCNQGK